MTYFILDTPRGRKVAVDAKTYPHAVAMAAGMDDGRFDDLAPDAETVAPGEVVARAPVGEVSYKPGIPAPSDAIRNLMQCTVDRTGLNLRVNETSGGHAPGNPHTRELAADVAVPQRALRAQVMQALADCGAVFQLDEYAHPSKGSNGGHIHAQLVPGKGGAVGPYLKSGTR